MTPIPPRREARIERVTNETHITVRLVLDGTGESAVKTGLGFLDHMLTSLARHGRFDLEVEADGDLWIDDHHTSEDVALVLGEALVTALGDRRGIQRFGSAYVPMDEALARAVVDLSGRPWPVVNLDLKRDALGGWAAENIQHFFNSLAIAGRANVHIDVLRGDNDHHKVEGAFKALALALRAAVRREGQDLPTTKGMLQ